MAACLTCGVALAEAWLDVYCAPCLEQVDQHLADLLVESRAKELAALAWRPYAWWWRAYRPRQGRGGPEAA